MSGSTHYHHDKIYMSAENTDRREYEMFTNEEMEVLNEMAYELVGCYFEDLDLEDQDMIECMAMDRGLI